MIPYGHQWIDDDDIAAVVEILKSDWLTTGPKVEEFEKAVADYCGAKYAVAVSSATAGLHLACLVAGVRPGDEVITTPLTFAATANAIIYCGAKPVFVDIDIWTHNIDPKKIPSYNEFVLSVDFAGQPADMDKIKSKVVIEDAAHSLGAEYKGRKVGTLADLTVFSFHPVKPITTGEGGMVVTNNKDYYEKMKTLRHHGQEKSGLWHYVINTLGYNYRLTDFQCALGISQLKRLDMFNVIRRQLVLQYNRAFADLDIVLPYESPDVQSSWHLYVIQVNNRDEVFRKLRAEGIGVQIHYKPLHLQPYYQQKFGYKEGDFPIAEAYYKRAISLPLFPKMTDSEIDKVITAVRKVVR